MYTYTKRKNNFIRVPSTLEPILNALQEQGIAPVLVGGCVRDFYLDKPIKDYDIELFGCSDEAVIEKTLSRFGEIKFVGKSFGVYKLHVESDEFDFALPRREEKTGVGYTGFEVTCDASMDFITASLRRDFTMNAMGFDYNTQTFLDPHNGLEDLKKGILRHIKDETFVEDPLRVYRAIQFCARFDLTLHEATFSLCQSIVNSGELETLSNNRIFEEFKKLLLKSKQPSRGFNLLKELNILPYFPELEALVGCEQEPEYHPEGDVWIHTLMCLDEMVKIETQDESEKLILMLAILCHDLGKPMTTEIINGKITSYKHEKEGVAPTHSFLERLTNDKKLIKAVVPLVEYHLAPFQLFLQQSSLKAVKRLASKVNIELLCKVALADCKGRTLPDSSKCDKAIEWLLETAQELNVQNEAEKPLVLGRDLLQLGMQPSQKFGEILEFAYELQLDNPNHDKKRILEAIKKHYL